MTSRVSISIMEMMSNKNMVLRYQEIAMTTTKLVVVATKEMVVYQNMERMFYHMKLLRNK